MSSGTDGSEGAGLYARGMGSPLGKFTNEVKTHLDEATFNEWLRLCSSKEVTSSELLRDVIYLICHGKTPAELAADDRRSLLNSLGPNGAVRLAVRGEVSAS